MTERHHTWEQFEKEFVNQPVSARYSPSGSPELFIFSDSEQGRIGIEIALKGAGDIKPIPLKSLALDLKFNNSKYAANFWISTAELFEQFYSLATHIADLVQLQGVPVQLAIEEAIEKIKALLAAESLLGDEKVVGLWGELWLLNQLIDLRGGSVVDNWKGATKAIHDFQFEDIELEVKTTRNEKRKHIISSLTQLNPSPEFNLYICSIQIEASSDQGSSLPEMIRIVENKLSGNAAALKKLCDKLKLAAYSPADAPYYTVKYYLRSEPALVSVDSGLPRISPELLERRFGSDGSVRIDTVNYRLDLTGLELPRSGTICLKVFGEESNHNVG